MQTVEISDAAYRKLMKYSLRSGECASSVITSLIENAEREDAGSIPNKANLSLLERDCARVMRETKKWATQEEVFKRVL